MDAPKRKRESCSQSLILGLGLDQKLSDCRQAIRVSDAQLLYPGSGSSLNIGAPLLAKHITLVPTSSKPLRAKPTLSLPTVVRDASEREVWLLIRPGWRAGPLFLQPIVENFALYSTCMGMVGNPYRNLFYD